MTIWDWGWILWLVMFGVFEGAALASRQKGSTLSEHIWKWFDIRNVKGWHRKRWALAIFMVWLLVHMVGGIN